MKFDNKIIDGDNYHLKFLINSKKVKKIFFLSGEISFVRSGAKRYFKSILKKKEVFYFFKKNKYVEIKELIKLIRLIKNFKPDLIIAVGGGSVLDYAKLANNLDNDDLESRIIKKKSLSFKKKTKLLAIPTTAGSGSEVTSSGVVYVNRIKYSIEDIKMVPDYFFLFPKFVINANSKIRAASALDGIAQSIESIISLKSNHESLKYSLKSLDIFTKNINNYFENNNNKNTIKMCIASNLAGKAINISRTTAPHAVSYPFTSHYGIDHGHAVILTLKNFLNFNYKNIDKSISNFSLHKRYQEIFKVTKSQNIKGLNLFLDEIINKSKVITNYKKLGINIDKFSNVILREVNLQRLANNPLKLGKKDIKNIILNEQL
tara:strand:- start:970 stop:2094 length:1125 start_codon:yes stop_codon:yes gene_type:complete